MALTVTVTPGKQFASTEKVTIPKLNQLGQPTFSVTGTVGTSEITDASVTAAKLVAGAVYYTSTVTFSSGDYDLDFAPNVALTDGLWVAFKANANGVPGINGIRLQLDGGTAKKLFKNKTETLKPGDIVANQIVEARYDTAGDGGAGAWQMTSHTSRTANYFQATTTTGTDAYAVTLTPPGSYTLAIADLEGVPIRWKVPNANTGAVTVNVTIGGVALGARPLRRQMNVPLVAGDLKQGQIVEMIYEVANDAYQLQSQSGGSVLEYVHTDTGTANAYAIAPGTAYTSYSQLQGRPLYFRAANTNTGSSTLAVSGLATPPTIKKHIDRNLDANDIKVNGIVEVVYDGTVFQLVNPSPPSAAKAWLAVDLTSTQNPTINNTPSGNNLTVTGHGLGSTPPTTLNNVQLVSFAQGTTLPGGLSANTPYYARPSDANTITLHTTAQGAIDNTSTVTLGAAGSGTNRLIYVPSDSAKTGFSKFTGYNIAGVRHVTSGASATTGSFVVYFRQSFSAADYALVASLVSNGSSRGIFSYNGAPTADYCAFITEDNSGSAFNPSYLSLVVAAN
jgi:hypothetical protein